MSAMGHKRTFHKVAAMSALPPKPNIRSGTLAMTAKAKEQRGVECLQRSQAARLARKCPRAFFPSLAASAMLSKNTGERSTGADLPAQ
jgi:hypothetical protein